MATSDAVRFRGRRRALSLRRSRQHARDLPVRTCPVHLHILLRAAAGSMDRRAHWRTYRGPLGRRLAGHGRTFLERVLDGRPHDRCRRCIAAQRASPAAAGRCEPVAMDTYGRSGAEACAGWRPSPQPLGRHCFWFSLYAHRSGHLPEPEIPQQLVVRFRHLWNVPRIWTLFDAEQTPLLFHMGNLLFHAVGPALQIGGLAGLVFLAWRHTRPDVGSADLGSRHVVVAGKLDCQEHEVPPAPRAPSMCRHGGLDRGGSGSFYGFDHPHTTVLRRRIDATSAAQRWIADLRQDPDLVDSHILAAGRSLQLGDFEPARAHLARARVVRPGHHLAQLLACEVELRASRPHEASKLWRAWLCWGLQPRHSVGLRTDGDDVRRTHTDSIGSTGDRPALLGDRQALRLPNHTVHQGPVF